MLGCRGHQSIQSAPRRSVAAQLRKFFTFKSSESNRFHLPADSECKMCCVFGSQFSFCLNCHQYASFPAPLAVSFGHMGPDSFWWIFAAIPHTRNVVQCFCDFLRLPPAISSASKAAQHHMPPDCQGHTFTRPVAE